MANDQDIEGTGPTSPDEVEALLRARYARTRRGMGPEPEGLEEIALYLDGALTAERAAAVDERLEREPELGEIVAELRRLDQTELASNVVPLVIPSSRSTRIGDALPSLKTLATRDRQRSSLRLAIMGVGVAAALAAILFLATRPPMESQGTRGAGLAGQRDDIAIGFEPSTGPDTPFHAVIEVEAPAAGVLSVLLATPEGTRPVGLCEAEACLVTQDRVSLSVGTNRVRALIAGGPADCAYLLALTSDGRGAAASVDPHAAAARLGAVVSGSGCVLDSPEQLSGIAGVRHVAFMQVPVNP